MATEAQTKPETKPRALNPEFARFMGELMYLALNSPLHRQYPLFALEERFLTPLSLNQYRLYRTPEGPIAAATWALVSDELDARLKQEEVRLTTADWNSGPNLWYTELIAPFGQVREIVQDLTATIFPDHVGRARRVNTDGTWSIQYFPGKNTRAA